MSSITDEQTRAQRTQLLDRLAKGTIIGSLLLPILVAMSNPSMGTLAMTNSLQRHLSVLTQHAAEVGMCMVCVYVYVLDHVTSRCHHPSMLKM